MTVWLTGRPCAGKTTIARELKIRLARLGVPAVHLDGDDVRTGLNADLGFSTKHRRENLRRVAHVARLFNQNGFFVIAAFVSPTNKLRRMIRDIVGNFKLCYVQCDPKVCEARDLKGMYRKARQGRIKCFTGVSAPFEEPRKPEICVNTVTMNVKECVAFILDELGFF